MQLREIDLPIAVALVPRAVKAPCSQHRLPAVGVSESVLRSVSAAHEEAVGRCRRRPTESVPPVPSCVEASLLVLRRLTARHRDIVRGTQREEEGYGPRNYNTMQCRISHRPAKNELLLQPLWGRPFVPVLSLYARLILCLVHQPQTRATMATSPPGFPSASLPLSRQRTPLPPMEHVAAAVSSKSGTCIASSLDRCSLLQL